MCLHCLFADCSHWVLQISKYFNPFNWGGPLTEPSPLIQIISSFLYYIFIFICFETFVIFWNYFVILTPCQRCPRSPNENFRRNEHLRIIYLSRTYGWFNLHLVKLSVQMLPDFHKTLLTCLTDLHKLAIRF